MSVVRAAAIQSFECPYCHASSSILYSFQAMSLTAADFGALLQMGWCRCGSLIYRPDPNVRCCPQFSMRIKTSDFAPTRKHRRIIRNFAMQPDVRHLGQSLDKVLKELRLIRQSIEYPYPSWFIRSQNGLIQSDIVPALCAAISVKGPEHRVRNQLMHFIVHRLQEIPNVVLSSLKFDGSGSIFLRISQYDCCSFCDCGAESLPCFSERLTWVIRSDDDLIPHWENIYLDTDVLDKWELTSMRRPKLRTVQSEKCRLHDRHKSIEEFQRKKPGSYKLFDDVIDDNLVIAMEPCSYSDEKFNLYLQYQILVHNDSYDFPTREKFQECMVRSPIVATEDGFGSFHRCYRRKDTEELIAFTLVDMVPNGLNSQYFIWSQQWKQFSLGIFSILDEIQMVERRREIEKIEPYHYIGIYVETCSKMSYKRQFRPSELRMKGRWVPTEQALEIVQDIDICIPLLQCVEEHEWIQIEDICEDLLVKVDSKVLTFQQFCKQFRFTFEQLKELFLFSVYAGDLARNFVYVLS